MPRAYSNDLRARVVGLTQEGASVREAAAQFGVSVSSVVKWSQRFRLTGSAGAKPMGGDQRSKLKAHREPVLAIIEAEPDLTLDEIRARLAAQGILVGRSTIGRFFEHERISFKKNAARHRATAP
jgi:transposase